MRERLSTRKLFGKFLLVQMPVFALASILGLTLLASIFASDERNQLSARVGNLAARVGALVARDTVQTDVAQMETYLGLLMSDTAVRCAEVTVSSHPVAAAPRKIGCKGQTGYQDLRLPVPGRPGQVMTIKFTDAELALVNAEKSRFTYAAITLSLLMASLASWFAFSWIIGRPVRDLLTAIRRSANKGGASYVSTHPSDELGTVIAAFNKMQGRLASEAEQRQQSLQRLQQIYEETPGLMFSMNCAGDITNVSGYWLETMGYERAEVIGKSLQHFLAVAPDAQKPAVVPLHGASIAAMPLQIATRGNAVLEVQLSAALQPPNDAGESDYLCVLNDVTSLNAASRRLRLQSVTDHLTQLPNRQAFVEFFDQINNPSDSPHGLTMLFIDLDNFKWINDTHGHEAGDVLLREAAFRIRRAIGEGDFLARLGGDEFAIILRDPESIAGAQAVADNILATMLQPFTIWEITAHVGCSIGIAGPLSAETDLSELMRLADLAMYKSKQDGRGKVTVYSAGVEAAMKIKLAGVDRVRLALEHHQLRLHYQPIICLKELRPCGAEALLRFEDGGSGLSPAEFIMAAENSGLIAPVGDFVVATGLDACRSLASGDSAALHYISVNLSPRQLEPGFMTGLLGQLRAQPALARHLVFEITETALLNHDERIAAFFTELRAMGARIALDDFGTGYSSLSHLANYPVDIIKLDRSFIRHIDNQLMPEAQRHLALVKAAATLCRELGIQMVAEGIETDGELATVVGLGITFGQGYLFSRALPEDALRDWVKAFGKHPARPMLSLVG